MLIYSKTPFYCSKFVQAHARISPKIIANLSTRSQKDSQALD